MQVAKTITLVYADILFLFSIYELPVYIYDNPIYVYQNKRKEKILKVRPISSSHLTKSSSKN